MTGATSGAGNAYLSGLPEFNPFFSGVIFLPYFPYHFTIQPTFLPYFSL
jgi:hypothetical protein